MTTAIRTAMLIGVTALVVSFAVGPRWVYAQTPAQREAERVQQLQIDNARRTQDESSRAARESSRAIREWSPSTPGSSPSRSTGAGAAQPAAPDICKAKPVRAGERNAVLGRWRMVDVKAAGGDALTQYLAVAVCSMYSGGLEFRERSMLVHGQAQPATYGRDGDVWLVCAGDAPGSFRLQGPNRLNMVKPACVFDRVGAGPSATAPGQATAAGADAARPAAGSQQSSQRWR